MYWGAGRRIAGRRGTGRRGPGGVAQQHALEPEAPAVLVEGHEAELLTVLAGESPAHAAVGQPAPQALKFALLDGEATPEGSDIQCIQHLADAEAALRQLQQHQDQSEQRIGLTGHPVGDGEGNMARIARRQLTEDRLDIGGISVDVRHHHQDVARPQRFALPLPGRLVGTFEGRQQAVMQNLDFTQRRVGADQTDGIILRLQPARSSLGQGALAGMHQLENLILDLMQQRCLLGRRILADARHEDVQFEIETAVAPGQRALEFIQIDDEVTPLGTQPGQQRIGLEVQLLLRQPGQRRCLGVTGTLSRDALAVHAQAVGSHTAPHGFAVGDDIAPVMTAGIGDHQVDVHHPGQRMQRIQRLPRQCRDAEHEQPWRQRVAA